MKRVLNDAINIALACVFLTAAALTQLAWFVPNDPVWQSILNGISIAACLLVTCFFISSAAKQPDKAPRRTKTARGR